MIPQLSRKRIEMTFRKTLRKTRSGGYLLSGFSDLKPQTFELPLYMEGHY
jgi:hypothetical protein